MVNTKVFYIPFDSKTTLGYKFICIFVFNWCHGIGYGYTLPANLLAEPVLISIADLSLALIAQKQISLVKFRATLKVIFVEFCNFSMPWLR